jgi:hypothetical protein
MGLGLPFSAFTLVVKYYVSLDVVAFCFDPTFLGHGKNSCEEDVQNLRSEGRILE